jgi:hypothetical protein
LVIGEAKVASPGQEFKTPTPPLRYGGTDMNAFARFNPFARRRRVCRRPSRRLTSERLEDRRMFNVDYHGGSVISNVHVQEIFYGSAWYNDSSLESDAAQLNSYFNFITQSSYMDMLTEYNTSLQSIGHGSVAAGSLGVNVALPSVIDDSMFQNDLSSAISHGSIAQPDANELYVIFTPPNVEVTMGGGNSLQNFLGYHSHFTDSFGFNARYAVIVDPIGNADAPGLSTFQQQTAVSSHELAEAVTDPDGRGWYDSSNGAEIGDLAVGQFVYLNNYAVQKEWSNRLGGPESPAGATLQPVQPLVVGGGLTLQVTEGSELNDQIIGSFYDPNGDAGEGSYQITVNWGDGTSGQGGLVDEGGGNFYIVGSHAYQGEGGHYQISFTVNQTDLSLSGQNSSTAVVTDSPVEAQGGYSVTASSDNVQNVLVATFVDPAGNDSADDYQATIDWGDQSASAGNIVFDSTKGVFDVYGSHSYDQSAYYQIHVTISHGTAAAVQVTSAISVPQAPIQATGGYTVSAAEGAAFTNQLVATFTDPANAGNYTARIDFGDGSSAAGQVVSEGGGSYEVLASHTYAGAQSPETITVTITRNSDGDTATAVSSAVVAGPSIHLTGDFTIQATAGVSFSQQEVATFINTAGSSPAGSYSASIDWGDGQTSSGSIVADPSGGFDVLGGHDYPAAGLFRIEIYVRQGSGPDVSAASRANVVSGGTPGGDPMPSKLGSISEQLTHNNDYYGAFVTWAYQQFLGRAADASGLTYWVGKMQGGLTDEQLETTFISTPEYIAVHGGSDVNWVIGMYHDLLGRAPDADGLRHWINQIEAGESEYDIALGFATSPEREGIVVTNDYNKYLLRAPTQADINGWVNLFEKGGLQNEDVVAGFIASQEYYNNAAKGEGGRTEWVDSVFEDLYNRQPTSNELTYWLAEMNGSTFF